jgi:hypothetical protein
MGTDFFGVAAQIIPVLLLAGVFEWPGALNRVGEIAERRAATVHVAQDAQRDDLTRADEFAAASARLDALARWERSRRWAVLWSIGRVSIWTSMLVLPMVAIVAEYLAIHAVISGSQSDLMRGLVGLGLTSALVYIAFPLLIRAYVDAQRTTRQMADLREEMRATLKDTLRMRDGIVAATASASEPHSKDTRAGQQPPMTPST